MNSSLGNLLKRVESWPEDARRELEQLARDIEAEIGKGEYRATASELAGIDRGMRDSAEGKFATTQQVEDTLGKLRR
jgi:predicted transcriptional regulator